MSFTHKKSMSPRLPYMLDTLHVFFKDESCLKAIEVVLDEEGNIRGFPGIIKDDRWAEEQKVILRERVLYEAEFYPLGDGRFLMLWLVQPSGTDWMDSDGFGIEDDLSIMLYSVVSENGTFEKPFELYSLDMETCCHDFDHIVD